MNEMPIGPWDKKLTEYIKSLPVVLIVHNLKEETIEYEIQLDYGNAEHRKYIGRVSFWAFVNGMSTEIMAKKEWEK